MKDNKLRKILNEGKPSVSTRLCSTWAFLYEVLGSTGKFDYVEFLAECAPFSHVDLENMCRASELYDMGSMIKTDYQNRAYVTQKAIAAGFQSVLFCDHETVEDFKESISFVKANSPEYHGHYGYPNRRYIGCQPTLSQMDHAKRINDVVLAFMIEKESAVKSIEQICEVPGIDMIQFGPSDFSMSCGHNKTQWEKECLEAEKKCIKTALSHGIQPRCEIGSADGAKYYIDLGVRHFSVGDQFKILKGFWSKEGEKMASVLESELK